MTYPAGDGVSHTDKTDPYRVKVARYGEHYWAPEWNCRCGWCKAGAPENAHRRREENKRQARDWQRDYEDVTA